MKKLSWILGMMLVAFIIIMSGCGTTAYVQKDDSFDFSKVKTYAWVHAEKSKTPGAEKNATISKVKTNDLVDTKIRQSIDKNLGENGWQQVSDKPDVLLVYDVDVQKENRNVNSPVYSDPLTRWFYNPYSGRYVSMYYPSQFVGYNNSTESVNAGTLTLTIMNAKTEKTIWQGWTTSDINGRRMTDKEIDGHVKAIIKKLG